MKKKIEEINSKIIRIKKSNERNNKILSRINSLEKITENEKRKKERAHRLIKLGALFEILGIDQENQEALLGFLNNYKNLLPEEKIKCYNNGKIIFLKRKEDKEINKKWSPSKEDILYLLQISMENKNLKDCISEIYKRYKKKTFEELTKDEYDFLLQYYKKGE